MKSLIRILILTCSFQLLAQNNMINLSFAPSERQQAQWVNAILVKRGIPLDFIRQDVSYRPCSEVNRSGLLSMCINEQKDLKILYFDREQFFWQMKPILEI